MKGRKYYCSEAIGLTMENQFTVKFECAWENCPRGSNSENWDEVFNWDKDHETCYLRRWWRNPNQKEKSNGN